MKLSLFSHARRLLLALAAVFGVLLTAAPAQADGGHVSDFTYEIRPNHTSGMCLEVADWSLANGAAVRQWPCTGGANQQWRRFYEPNSSTGPYWYVNVNSGMCLEIGGWATYNGATANQWDCHWGANQTWYGNDGRIRTPVEYVQNKCLEIADWRVDAGAPARLWDCTGGANQSYYFRRIY
ncbi:RICIN domain-containing protein [Streptomyces sp. NPDC002463]|uniref:RICIN domain-containing protein n=1 Tax=Streptomyces sp. NPDC002463 TaxID=3364645 RepID=UPI0036A512D1